MSDTQLAKLRLSKMGFIFQSYNLIPVLSALENVLYPLRLDKDNENKINQATKALEDVGLGDLLHRKPNELSGGQRQRVAIARALANDPYILFADEPTANLDSKTSIQIIELIDKLRREKGTTLIASSHHELLIESCENKAIMVDGKIQEIVKK
jgi:putative ABC transport system ATP-binding protein